MSRRQDKKIINNSHSETLLENKDDNKNLDKIIEDISNEDLSLSENIKIDESKKNEDKNKNIDKKDESKKNKNTLLNKNERKTLNTPLIEKLINKILNLDEDNKVKYKKKNQDNDFFFFGFNNKQRKKKSQSTENIDSLNESSFNMNTSLVKHKKKTIIKGIIDLNKENEWSEFLDEYKKRNEEKKFTKKLKLLFNINSDFMVIWKVAFSIFYMVILYMFFFKYVLLELPDLENNEKPKKRILYLYNIINIMFGFDLIFTIIVIINNGGSLITFLKLPLKIYMIIPFSLNSSSIPFIIPKFCRYDLFKRVFNTIEQFIVGNITHYIQNYNLRNFIIYTNRMFAYLLEFGLYAHFTCCILSYLDDLKYISVLYYTIETFTTIGFGENSPKTVNSILICILNLFIAINLFTIITCNVNYLTSKLYSFSRETSLKQKLEFLIFKIQNSTGKVFPLRLKQLISFFIVFRRGLSYQDIKSQYEPILKVCRNKMIKEIRKSLLLFLRKEYSFCFYNCEKQFINSLLEVLKPKIFNKNKVIVNYGDKIKYLYFLINGELFAFNKNDRPVYTIFNSAIFCEYEFITGTLSEFKIQVHPDIPAYGFVINKEDWENIAKKYYISAKFFVKSSCEKRNTHLNWLDKSYENDNLKYEIKGNDNIENEINKNNINNLINEEEDNFIFNQNKIKKNNRISLALKKNEKYNLENIEIIKKIKNLNKEIQFLELSLIENKRKIFDVLSKNFI